MFKIFLKKVFLTLLVLSIIFCHEKGKTSSTLQTGFPFSWTVVLSSILLIKLSNQRANCVYKNCTPKRESLQFES